jgi:hypothetical protein
MANTFVFNMPSTVALPLHQEGHCVLWNGSTDKLVRIKSININPMAALNTAFTTVETSWVFGRSTGTLIGFEDTASVEKTDTSFPNLPSEIKVLTGIGNRGTFTQFGRRLEVGYAYPTTSGFNKAIHFEFGDYESENIIAKFITSSALQGFVIREGENFVISNDVYQNNRFYTCRIRLWDQTNSRNYLVERFISSARTINGAAIAIANESGSGIVLSILGIEIYPLSSTTNQVQEPGVHFVKVRGYDLGDKFANPVLPDTSLSLPAGIVMRRDGVKVLPYTDGVSAPYNWFNFGPVMGPDDLEQAGYTTPSRYVRQNDQYKISNLRTLAFAGSAGITTDAAGNTNVANRMTESVIRSGWKNGNSIGDIVLNPGEGFAVVKGKDYIFTAAQTAYYDSANQVTDIEMTITTEDVVVPPAPSGGAAVVWGAM